MPLSLGRNSRNSSQSTRTGKHRPVEAPVELNPTQDPAHDTELESYLAALAPDDTETTLTGKRFGGAAVHQVRLPPVAGEQLKELAAERDTTPQALAEEWILQRLKWEAEHTEA